MATRFRLLSGSHDRRAAVVVAGYGVKPRPAKVVAGRVVVISGWRDRKRRAPVSGAATAA
ncbi:hypothetical protein OQ496_06525 [Acetobacter suratthaniensis]|uniref:Uncharacterized protein n=1 Tax=Acetobacter suratthaniensis TaxID=1502841 RepID=A0ABS3LKD7_9PROT|nr:hypothetical protein [Acetobacter suratthaniensis]MBO1328054.1 hypothetical protein [Acetobacter suratthaniensis]MCX2566106.1 hypothetical protein [Acetobacter suratthaniensis]